MNNNHHTIPISIFWEDIDENIINIDVDIHKQIHQTQNIPYWVIRQYKKKVNWILIINDIVFNWRLYLWKRYFKNMQYWKDKQIESLLKYANKYWKSNNKEIKSEDKNLILEFIIQNQKEIVKNILKNKV
jgi:hypothetical protein